MENKNAVLLVDDDPSLLKSVGEILKNDYAVSGVKSGREALNILETGYIPDIILLDIDMPGLDGFETFAMIREMEDMPDVPIIFLTGVTALEARIKGVELNAEDYITKPFVKEILMGRMKYFLEKSKRLRELNIKEKDKQASVINEVIFEQAAANLSGTEIKILRLIVLGYSNLEISDALCYANSYVRKVISTIYEKKHVSNRKELKRLLQ